MSLNVDLLRSTFEQVKPIAGDAVTYFYDLLFKNYPEAKQLFKSTKMAQQKKLLINSLVFIVENVEDPAKLVPYLKKMGARHVKYGTEPEHYNWVGQTLLDTLSHFFAENWTSEAEETWAAAIEFIATTMLSGTQTKAKDTPKVQDNVIQLAAKDLANSLLKQYLNNIDAEIVKLAQQKAQKILLKSLEDEAAKVVNGNQKRAA